MLNRARFSLFATLVLGLTLAACGSQPAIPSTSDGVQPALLAVNNGEGGGEGEGGVKAALVTYSDGRLAILTVISPSNHYDREGVRDIPLTFKVTQ